MLDISQDIHQFADGSRTLPARCDLSSTLGKWCFHSTKSPYGNGKFPSDHRAYRKRDLGRWNTGEEIRPSSLKQRKENLRLVRGTRLETLPGRKHEACSCSRCLCSLATRLGYFQLTWG